VLAGGRSVRFGRDKLSAPYRGRPLLHHAVSALSGICEDVVVVLAPGREPTDPVTGEAVLAGLVRHRLRVALDPEEGHGPLMGLLVGLGVTTTEVALVVGGDMPRLVPAVLDDLLERLSIGCDDAVALDDGTGIRPLPAALRVGPARSAARRLLDAGERSLRALMGSLDALAVGRATWSAIDPAGLTLLDVDEAGDLGER
jgi:molybdopterin-guanine dinucleotide biosynthesis protein A